MRLRSFETKLLAFMLLYVLSGMANAGFVTHSWTGVVTNLGGTGASDPLVTALLGETTSYSYTFDDNATNFSADPTYGSYFNAISSYEFSVGGGLVGPGAIPDQSQISVWNDNSTYQDRFSAFVNLSGVPILGGTLEQVNVSMRDTTSAALSDILLPEAAPEPSLFNSDGWIQFFITTPSGPALVEARDLDVIERVSVPVPGTILLFGTGLFALLRNRTRHSNFGSWTKAYPPKAM